MFGIKLKVSGIDDGIQKLSLLNTLLGEHRVLHASGSGSGDIVNDLEALSSTVNEMRSTMSGLLEGTIACLRNYKEQMTAADQYIADSMAGEGK